MNHPAELALHILLSRLMEGASEISEATIDQITKDIGVALVRQFRGGKKREFRVRMSNIGRPYCQLWYEKNKPELAEAPDYNFVLNMMMGDIVEAVFKGLLTEAKVDYEDGEHVTLELASGTRVNGTPDISINGAIDDIKSASPWSYTNKFVSFDTLHSSDPFGYVAQLAGYAKASNKKAGGWWVVNKANGQFKYVEAEGLDVDQTLLEVDEKLKRLNQNEFARDFEPVEETFRSKPTGNKVLSVSCKFCNFKADCWPTLKTLPSIPSSARNPADVDYVYIAEG
jgi:hypothetical protein